MWQSPMTLKLLRISGGPHRGSHAASVLPVPRGADVRVDALRRVITTRSSLDAQLFDYFLVGCPAAPLKMVFPFFQGH